MPETYTCAACGGVFEKNWSDEQAVAEMESYFGAVPASERSIVCDDCYRKMHPEDHPTEVNEAIRKLKGDA